MIGTQPLQCHAKKKGSERTEGEQHEDAGYSREQIQFKVYKLFGSRLNYCICKLRL